jgi:hypothetical protein
VGEGGFDQVNALAVLGADLYAGGSFRTAGGIAASNVAKWDGAAWSALEWGVNGQVHALAASDSAVYAGGGFTAAGRSEVNGITQWREANHIAKWNGSAWEALRYGLSSDVYALAVVGPDLYAGGYFRTFFTDEGESPASYLAKWNGSEWSALGSGTNGPVWALAASGTNLYAGGWFSSAGDKVAGSIARARLGAAAGRLSNLAYSLSTGFSALFLDGTPGQPYRIQSSPSLEAESWTDLTSFIYTGPIGITDPSATEGPRKFYRAVMP